MSLFSAAWDKLYRVFNPHWDFTVGQSLAAFRTYLGTEGRIRMWVDQAEGTGHQASTVAILRQLSAPVVENGFGYAGAIDVYYETGKPGDLTLPKLQGMLPEVQGGTQGRVGLARVTLIEWQDGVIPPGQLNLGFTGAADNIGNASPDYAGRLNVRWFLRLQPWLWPAPEQIQFQNRPTAPMVLTRQKILGYESFKQRAYYLQTPIPTPQWALYDGTEYAEQAAIIGAVTAPPVNGVGVFPVYSIRSRKMQLPLTPGERMFLVLASVLASQQAGGQPAPGAESIILFSCDAFDDEQDREQLPKLIAGGLSQNEGWAQVDLDLDKDQFGEPLTPKRKAVLQNNLRGSVNRAAWLQTVNAVNRVRYDWAPSKASVTRQLDWLQASKNRVLFVQLGRTSLPLFQWLMQQSAWPAVFEGQNTGNVAVNIGRLYYHIARANIASCQYPTTIIDYSEYQSEPAFFGDLQPESVPQVPRRIQDAANLIQWPVALWSGIAAENVAEQCGGLVREYHAEAVNGPIHRYLADVRQFYTVVNNDKLRVGTSFLAYILAGQGAIAGTNEALIMPGETSDPLTALLAALNANLSDGTLKVVPGTFSAGPIFTFYTSFLGASGLVIESAVIAPRQEGGQLVEIAVTGNTTFLDIPLAAAISFTAPDGVILGNARYTYAAKWTLDEIPWIGFSNPFIELMTPNADAPLSGAAGGVLDGADVELAFRLPVAEGKWQLAGSFQKPYPSIAKFYALAGGVNLVEALPPPFNALAGFGMEGTWLVYDLNAKEVDTIGFRFSTSDSFRLIGTLTVENISVQVTVQKPASRTRRTDWVVSGTFQLGDGPDPAVIALGASGPLLKLDGSLVSGVITLTSLINTFCPGIVLNLPKQPVITEFSASFTPSTGDYVVQCRLNTDWPVVVEGTQIFSIDGLQLGAQRVAGFITAGLSGYVTIGSGANAFPLELSGVYSSASGWLFEAAQGAGSVVRLATLFNQFLPSEWQIVGSDYGIAGLKLSVLINTGAWTFSGRTAEPWTVPFIDGLSVSASLQLGWDRGYFARIDTEWTWQNIKLRIYFNYAPAKQTYGIIWGALEGSVTGPDANGDWVATLRFGSTVTLGSIIETIVSWATGSAFALEAPWSVLNEIPLSGLALTYTFNRTNPARNQVGFKVAIGPINLGFARIDSIDVLYNSQAQQKVAVTLSGSFPWNVGSGANGSPSSLGPWDASKPGTAPAAPGTGNQYLDLRLLALGQHVTIEGLTEAKTVQKAIERMAMMKDPVPGQIPDVTFDPESAWLIGADFGVLRFGTPATPVPGGAMVVRENTLPAPPPAQTGYLLTMQVVFNDPYLYGLRLALAGDAAKVFKGLDFQIMYRQVSETVGVYQAEITLPDVMRRLSVGAYTLTLPTFGIAVYTNGDFQVDVGFPWNEDFTRSFTIEAIIYPGIPLLGSAGFYFGKLSSASTDKVPKAVNGTFNPVLVFGFGMQVGFGKSIEYGVLKAGFSLTVVGIIEGVLAKFNRYLDDGSSGSDSQLQGAYYFWLRGTFGLVGRLYGSIDFAIIKADVNITIKLLLQLTYESYVSMSISVIVSVDVSVSVKIDLGLFSIRISFSFSMRVKETFTIENGGTPPWITSGSKSNAFLATPELRVRDFRLPSRECVMASTAADRWTRLLPSTAGPAPLSGWLAPALTVAHDERDTTNDPRHQNACYVFMSFIDTVPETGGTAMDAVMLTLGQDGASDTSFELLAKMILRWAIAATRSEDITPEALDTQIVTEADLSFLLETVLVSRDTEPVPIPPADIDTFMSRQFLLTLSVPPSTAGVGHATYFPLPPALRLTVPAYGTAYAGCDYAFADYNSIDDAALADLRRYFDQLAIQVQREIGPPPLEAKEATTALSMATWVQSDYFLLLTRQMVQAALDALRDFKYVLAGQSPDAIVNDVNTTGALPPDSPDAYTLEKLFAANPSHALNSGKSLTIGVTYAVAAPDSFTSIAVNEFRQAVSPLDLATANAANAALLRAGATIQYLDATYTVQAGNTLIDVAWHFGVTYAQFLSGATDLLIQTTLFNGGASMLVPLVTYQAQTGSTFTSIAGLPVYGSAFNASVLATQNAGRSILRLGVKVTYPSKPDYAVQANDTLADVARAFGVGLADLLANSNALTQPTLLADVALVVLPPFGCTTAVNDTLQSVAARFAAPAQVLGLQPANGSVADLFATTGTDGSPSPFLDVPHLVQYRVAELIAETQRSLAIQQLSRLSASYAMHGLRLPTSGITPKAKGIWVDGTAPAFTLPPKAGLYALTGQEIELPVLDAATGDFTMTLSRSGGPSWLLFGGGTSELTITVAPSSDDATRIAKARDAARSGPLDIQLQALGADLMYESQLASYPLTTVLNWQTPAAVTLPYGPPPSSGQVPALRIWKLPDALINLPDPHTPGEITPRFEPRLATYDEATGGTVKTPISSYGYATLVTFTIKRIPPVLTSPSTATTYEIAGAGGGDVVLLERIVAEVGANDSAFDQLILGYAPDASGDAPQGVQTGAPAGVTMSIAQVNLSTETRPDSPAVLEALVAEPLGSINPPSEFIRLLWEASITRSGGFYLYYYDSLGGAGLPARIFNDRNEATVSLIVIWTKGATPAASNRVTDYMNAVVTGDSIDTARSVVFAEAAPMEAPVTAAATLSLDALAEQTYSNAADLAEANAPVPLANGAEIVVQQGVYQAPPGGIALSAIVSRFGLSSVAQLQAANPQWAARGGLPDPLPFPVAVFLPEMTLTVGTSAHTASLSDISSYYGENLTALAAANGGVAGLFATGESIIVTGGPRTRYATEPAGVQGVTASRRVPPEVPTNPNDAGYASALLLNTFSLLNYQVAANVFFNASDMGLPAGPSVPGGDTGASHDKVRLPKTLAEGDEWEYKQAFPYPKFALSPRTAQGALPPAADDPYRGVGSILQVDFSWQDYYGNTIVTTLSSPSGSGPFNQPPMLTGYVDPIIALSQWPSVSAAWRVVAVSGSAELHIPLTFDSSRYDGLMSASAAGTNSVQAIFTTALDSASATTISSYALSGGVRISAAALGPDGKTVTLTTDTPLAADTTYDLTATNIQAQQTGTGEPPTYSGKATFRNPDDPSAQMSSLRENARRDLRVYTSLYYQLTDANGASLSIETSLLNAPAELSAAQKSALLGWLFTNADSIYAFIAAREAGNASATPPAPAVIGVALPQASRNTAQIYELSASFTIRRTGGAVLENLQTTAGIRSATTDLVPYVQNLDSTDNASNTLGLTAFANDFELALSVPGSYLLKVATGIDRNVVSSVRHGATLWAVRLGVAGTSQPISYAVNDGGKAAVFAPQPISNELQTRNQIPIYDYKRGEGISPTVSRTLDFVDIDMDVWGQQLFASVDAVLTPEFTSATQIVSARTSSGGTPVDYLQQILDQKKLLAESASRWMIPVYAAETADASAVQATFYQQLLSRLSNAYTTRAALQFSATVNADVDEPGTTAPPRLFGNIIDEKSVGEPLSDITLTSPKLSLQTSSSAPLPFLLMASGDVREGGAVVPTVDLSLTYDVTDIEHQISEVQGIDGYVASSWLSFVVPGETRPLTRALGDVTVPMVLRAFPASPSMVGQSGGQADPASTNLGDLTRWTYAFVFSLPFHYPQDGVYCEVEFNIAETALDALFTFIDAFPALAEFITVFPTVDVDLTGILATIDATTDDPATIQNASVALASFIELLQRITSTISGAPLIAANPPGRFGSGTGDVFEFVIREDSVVVDNPAKPALLVTITGAPPAGMGTPAVLVEPKVWTPRLWQSTATSFSYVYERTEGPETIYLDAETGQSIPDRTVVLPDLDILQRQDAWSTIFIKRNEDLGGPIAEPFVYKTPDVQFAAPYYPTIDSGTPVDIATIGSTTPVKTSLQQHLQTLFSALFADVSGSNENVTIQVESMYTYSIAPSLAPVALPIFMQAPLTVTLSGTLDTMIANWTAGITTWFDTYKPKGSEGTLRFDLTIMSNLTVQPMPLLRLRELFLRLADIVPPLATS